MASLVGADLSFSDLKWAVLDRAKLENIDFRYASVEGWNILGASLRYADLKLAENLDPDSLNTAYGVASGIGRTLLPEGVPPPAHWHVAEDGEEDGDPARVAYQAAYDA